MRASKYKTDRRPRSFRVKFWTEVNEAETKKKIEKIFSGLKVKYSVDGESWLIKTTRPKDELIAGLASKSLKLGGLYPSRIEDKET